MKNILKEYIDTLREIKKLEERREELVNQLVHVSMPDGKEFGEIVFDSRVHAKEIIIENLPDDTTDEEAYCKMSLLCNDLYYIQREKEIEAGRYTPYDPELVSTPCGNITDGSHEGW